MSRKIKNVPTSPLLENATDNNVGTKLSTNLASLGTDCISRQAAIDVLGELATFTEDWSCHTWMYTDDVYNAIKQLPPIKLEITHEQAIDYLHSTGWMQEHDRQMMLDGVHRLTAHPEIIRCRECKFASGDSRICMKFGHGPIGELDFCAWAERRTDG